MSKWFKNALFYEIYPTSYKDSNNDGIGDLNGITSKLEYVKELGFDSIWLNPFYKSPFMDGGYDVSDYFKVDEKFGTVSDFVKLTTISLSITFFMNALFSSNFNMAPI